MFIQHLPFNVNKKLQTLLTHCVENVQYRHYGKLQSTKLQKRHSDVMIIMAQIL